MSIHVSSLLSIHFPELTWHEKKNQQTERSPILLPTLHTPINPVMVIHGLICISLSRRRLIDSSFGREGRKKDPLPLLLIFQLAVLGYSIYIRVLTHLSFFHAYYSSFACFSRSKLTYIHDCYYFLDGF